MQAVQRRPSLTRRSLPTPPHTRGARPLLVAYGAALSRASTPAASSPRSYHSDGATQHSSASSSSSASADTKPSRCARCAALSSRSRSRRARSSAISASVGCVLAFLPDPG